MVYWLRFLYSTFLLPPGIIIAALAAGGWYWRKKSLLAAALVLYLVSIPLVSDRLLLPLESYYQPPAVPAGDVIVMLGGGATLDTPNVHGQGHLTGFAANRLLTAAQLYHALDLPIVVSGGRVLETSGPEADIARHILMGLGVPADKIIVESHSLNTAENASYTRQLLMERHLERPLLVTSAFHMRRAMLQFHQQGMYPTPYPTDYQLNTRLYFQPHQLWPTASALLDTSLALKEYLGLIAAHLPLPVGKKL